MKAEILMIGTELLLGQIQDTNATHMAQTLALHGINIYQKTTVGDNPQRIVAALDAALSRSDVVLCSGGLGPTEDDITRDCIAQLLGRKLEFREPLWNEIVQRFSAFRSQITENNKRQATLPEGALAVPNPHGTAPGVIVEDARGIIICMPGVPSELKPMLEAQVLPYLLQKFGIQGTVQYRILKVCGLGESKVDSLIGDLINAHENPTIGLLASPDAVRIRIAARAATPEAARLLIAPVEAALLDRLDGLVMGTDEDTLEGVVDRHLRARGWKMAVVETITGGMIAQRLSACQAASFAGGVVASASLGAVDAGSLLDRARGHLLESPFDCVLIVVPEPATQAAQVVFETPEGRQEWTVGRLGSGERGQVRTSVLTLERVRRWLEGVHTID